MGGPMIAKGDSSKHAKSGTTTFNRAVINSCKGIADLPLKAVADIVCK